MHLYVNPGLGTMGVPFRFLCLPEVTLHTLVPA
jgi:predicted MPP superfamily phosphohydrolase